MIDSSTVAAPPRSLEEHGRHYGKLKLAIAFTVGLSAPFEFKQCRKWKETEPLPDPEFGAALLKNRGQSRNPAVCLRASHLVGIDIDGEEGRALARELAPEKWPPTVSVRSGRPDAGLHMWYRSNERTRKHKIQLARTVMLSEDGYFICPPALHALAGRPYEFLPGRAPWEIEIADFPDYLQERLTAVKEEQTKQARADDHSPIIEGERHHHLLRIAGAMRYAGAGQPAIELALMSENQRRCVPPKSVSAVRALAYDIAGRYPPGAWED